MEDEKVRRQSMYVSASWSEPHAETGEHQLWEFETSKINRSVSTVQKDWTRFVQYAAEAF